MLKSIPFSQRYHAGLLECEIPVDSFIFSCHSVLKPNKLEVCFRSEILEIVHTFK